LWPNLIVINKGHTQDRNDQGKDIGKDSSRGKIRRGFAPPDLVW